MSRWPVWVLWALVAKLLLAYGLPMTGDEAYFVLWGRQLDYGYYDHPPMAGWLTWLMSQWGEHRVLIRLPAVLTEFVVAAVLYRLMAPADEAKARLLAGIILLSPLSLVFVMTLTDTGCVLFSTLSFAAAAQSMLKPRWYWPLLAGITLGLAFLSKYFAAILAMAFLLFYLGAGRSYWRQGLWLFASALPFLLLNLYWNWQHCWANVVFNVVNRGADQSLNPAGLALYAVFLVCWLLPPAVLAAWRHRHRLALAQWPSSLQPLANLTRTVAMTVLLAFAVVSVQREIGLHWLAWFVAFIWLCLWPLPMSVWQRLWQWAAGLGAGLVLLLLCVVYAPLSVWDSQPRLQWYLLAMREAPAILAEAERQSAVQADHLAATSYAAASVFAYQQGEPVAVIGKGSKYGRQDDFWTDWRQWQGESVLVLLKRRDDLPMAEQWFERVERWSVRYKGQPFWFMYGRGFDYRAYRQQVLLPTLTRYYQQPAWLPTGRCPFKLQYALPEW